MAPDFAISRRQAWIDIADRVLLLSATDVHGYFKDGFHEYLVARAFRMKRVFERMLDERAFLSPYGVRAVSRVYLDHPYVFQCDGFRSEVKYVPAEFDTDMFGGNSNWRGPVWMPINYLLFIESLCRFGALYGDGFHPKHSIPVCADARTTRRMDQLNIASMSTVTS